MYMSNETCELNENNIGHIHVFIHSTITIGRIDRILKPLPKVALSRNYF